MDLKEDSNRLVFLSVIVRKRPAHRADPLFQATAPALTTGYTGAADPVYPLGTVRATFVEAKGEIEEEWLPKIATLQDAKRFGAERLGLPAEGTDRVVQGRFGHELHEEPGIFPLRNNFGDYDARRGGSRTAPTFL